MIPSFRDVILCDLARTRIRMHTAVRRIESISSSGAAWIGVRLEVAPRMNMMLNRQDPTALPNAIPESPFWAATMDVISSGREVPIATIVRPTSVSLMPRERAIRLALSTTRLPPQMIAIRPPTI